MVRETYFDIVRYIPRLKLSKLFVHDGIRNESKSRLFLPCNYIPYLEIFLSCTNGKSQIMVFVLRGLTGEKASANN